MLITMIQPLNEETVFGGVWPFTFIAQGASVGNLNIVNRPILVIPNLTTENE